MNDKVISIKNISKKYVFRHEKPTFVGSVLGLDRPKRFTALKNISLDIYKGQKLGIIGSNGSGKTTLLKIISGITSASSGKVKTRGKVVSLIGLDAGFHPELSGRENIFLNGLVIGMKREQIKEKLEEIIDFSGIREFIDEPLFTYSSGMSLRLGFSIAVYSDPDILLLDEGIVVGDDDFQNKAFKRINQFFNEGKTIILVSHWMDFLKRNCNEFIWLEKGEIKASGGAEVIDKYIDYSSPRQKI